MDIGRPGPAHDHLGILLRAGAVGGAADGELLDRFLARGDPSAFEALVARHGPMVLRVCRQVLRDAHDAQDAFQATFLVLARRAAAIRRRASSAGWLFSVARRVAIHARADAARRRHHERQRAALAAEAHTGGDPGAAPDWTALHEELARLPDRYREAVVLCHLEGLTHAQAARRIGCPPRTLETRLRRARARLHDRLTRRGAAPAAALLSAVASRQIEAAHVPTGWVAGLLRAAYAPSASNVAAGVVPAGVEALARGVLHTMRFETLKTTLATLAALALLTVGFAGMARSGAGPAAAAQDRPAVPKAKPGSARAAPDELKHDDGKMAGRKSIAGSGHAVRFETPGDGGILTAVRVHGARYGYPQPPNEDFTVTICDAEFRPIAEFPFPYSRLQRGDARWVTLNIKPTEVPRTFIVGVSFNPERTKGVYVSHDAEASGASFVGLPGNEPRPFEAGDWLIRAVVGAPGTSAAPRSRF